MGQLRPFRAMSAAVACLIVTACSTTGAPAPAPEPEVTVAVWGGDEDAKTYQQRVDLASERVAGVKVKLLHVRDDYGSKIQKMISDGNPPDIIQVAESVHSYSSKNQLLPLNPFIDTAVFRDRVNAQSAFDWLQYHGYTSSEINVMMSDQTRKHFESNSDRDDRITSGNMMTEGVATGGTIGTAVGATLGAIAEKVLERTPLQRLGDDEDLKGAALLFCSAAGKHITGQILAVDGGSSAV